MLLERALQCSIEEDSAGLKREGRVTWPDLTSDLLF